MPDLRRWLTASRFVAGTVDDGTTLALSSPSINGKGYARDMPRKCQPHGAKPHFRSRTNTCPYGPDLSIGKPFLTILPISPTLLS
jgi:hypothetical protein